MGSRFPYRAAFRALAGTGRSSRTTYQQEIRHAGLHKYRVVRSSNPWELEQKVQAQCAQWDDMWEKKQAVEQRKAEKEQKARDKEAKKQYAIDLTKEAQEALDAINKVLNVAVHKPSKIDWDSLKDLSEFDEPTPLKPEHKSPPPEPVKDDPKYRPKLGILGIIFSSIKENKVNEAIARFKEDHEKWIKSKENIKQYNNEITKKYEDDLSSWNIRKDEFLKEQIAFNEGIDKFRNSYFEGNPDAIEEVIDKVMGDTIFNDDFPQDYDIEYYQETRMLVVEYLLPPIEMLPRTKTVKYIQTRDEIVEKEVSDSALKKMYDNLLYQIVLALLHRLYKADEAGTLDSIVINGWVEYVDRSTGKDEKACIMSIQAGKDEFNEIKLDSVDPKQCFKKLKGVGSSKLHGLSPVAPIIMIDRTDKRFVSSYDVAEGLDESVNIAAMDWEDFEHLVRELFEKEFSQSGGEVKVTRASRDGGVDAVAFDPDPIRGGKIVIQAKRYTNVVGVSAVRDLYGTVVNEGATKGILITTAEYGPDAYEFAKGKPLTLLNGSNLLHMLQNHGYKAKIDLKEAKKILAEKEEKA